MLIELNNNVYFVQGNKNGAIYDLNHEKVYSINEIACVIIMKLFKRETVFSKIELNYIEQLHANQLLNKNNEVKEYRINIPKIDAKLDLVWLEITQACNLKCVHCYEGAVHVPAKNTLSVNDWVNIINDLKMVDIKNVVVIGGEPCCYNNLMTILNTLKEARIKTTIITNATLMDEKLKFFLIENSNLFSVKVSIYGPNASIHEAVTKVPGSFDKMVSNVSYLVNNNVRVKSAVIAMKENQDYLEETKEFIENLGVQYTRFDVIRNVFGGTQTNHIPTNSDVINSGKYVRPNFKINKEQFFKNFYQNSCWCGKLVITETGEILPCVFERDISLGNIKTNSLLNILNCKKLKECWYFPLDKIETCKYCEFRYACKDCRPLGKAVSGNIYAKNPRCQYNPYKGVWNE